MKTEWISPILSIGIGSLLLWCGQKKTIPWYTGLGLIVLGAFGIIICIDDKFSK